MTSAANEPASILNPSTRVAVYGTLKRGLSNHYLLQDARYMGRDCLTAITLYDLGPYPGAKIQTSEGIIIEVFEVTQMQLAALDALEEYNTHAPEQGMYNRVQLKTRYGSAWVYIYNLEVEGLPAQRRGSWQPGQTRTASEVRIVHGHGGK